MPQRSREVARPRYRGALVIALLVLCFPIRGQEPEQYAETIDVVRYLLTVRARGPRGEAVTDLVPADFIVQIDGRRAEVEAADWIGAEAVPAGLLPDQPPPIAGGTKAVVVPPARTVVFFVQTDFGRASERLRGQMKFNAVAPQIVSMFRESDRVAVVSHDSHLKLRLDFTADSKAVLDAIRQSIFTREVPAPEPAATGPSFVASLDAGEMRRAATGEAALLLVARALAKIEGEKVLVLAGWGFGDYKFGTPWIFYEREWPEAIRTLQAHRIPVISLGTGLGGQLTSGLVSVAQQTGGFYAPTQILVHQGLQAIDTFLEGHYEIVLRLPSALTAGEHPVTAVVKRAGTSLQAPEKVIVVPDSKPQLDGIAESADDADAAVRSSALFAEAMQLLLDGEARRAEEILTQVVTAQPGHADAWFERGMLRAAGDNRDGAVHDLRQYLQIEPRGRRAAEAAEMLAALEE